MITEHEKSDSALLDTNELAARWEGRWSARTLANWRAGKIKHGPPFYRIRGKVVYRLTEVMEWENRQHHEPDPAPREVHI